MKNGKVLIELDSADLRDKITNQEIDFQTTVSVYIEADEQRAIQASDNQGLVQAAYQAAQAIPDEKVRAQALLDIVNEINYFTHQQN